MYDERKRRSASSSLSILRDHKTTPARRASGFPVIGFRRRSGEKISVTRIGLSKRSPRPASWLPGKYVGIESSTSRLHPHQASICRVTRLSVMWQNRRRKWRNAAPCWLHRCVLESSTASENVYIAGNNNPENNIAGDLIIISKYSREN